MSTLRQGIISGGCWTSDRIKVVDAWPAEEELANIIELDHQGGGSAFNTGIDLRKLSAEIPVFGIGLVGDDADGQFLLDQATAHGVDVSGIKTLPNVRTSFTDVMTVQSSGRRTFFHYTGTNDHLTPDHFDFTATTAKILHLGLLGVHRCLDSCWEHDANGWVNILKKARAAGLHTNIEMVSIDPYRNRELCLPCLPYLDTLIINDHEAGGLVCMETLVGGTTDIQACEQAAKTLLSLGAMQHVVVHYPEGAVCVSRDQSVRRTTAFTVPAEHIKSAVGAGDAFAAGMLFGLHENWTLDDTLELAHAAAAASVRSSTTVGSVVSVDDCLAFARSLAPVA